MYLSYSHKKIISEGFNILRYRSTVGEEQIRSPVLALWYLSYNLEPRDIIWGLELAPVSVSILVGSLLQYLYLSGWELAPVSVSILFGSELQCLFLFHGLELDQIYLIWPVVYSSICIYIRFKLTPVSLSMQDWSLLQYLDLTMELIPRGFKGLVLIPENCDFQSQFGLLNQQFSIFLLSYFFWSAYAFWTKNYKMTKS